MKPDIPVGKTREDIKTRERIIKNFYAKWIAVPQINNKAIVSNE